MITDATEPELDLARSTRSQLLSIPDFRAIKTSCSPSGTSNAVSRTPPPSLRNRIKRKFDTAVDQNLVFCNGHTLEEVEGECFKFRIFTAHGLSKKTCFWTAVDTQDQSGTGSPASNPNSIVPSLLKQIRPSVSRRSSHATSNLIPNITTLIQMKVSIPDNQVPDVRGSCLPQSSLSSTIAAAAPPKPLCKSPFSPPEPALTVGPIGSGHTLLLNKYCVLPRQLLLITNDFQPQEGELRREDWKALVDVLMQLSESTPTYRPGTTSEHLVFFNCGRNSGASQAHRHLQIIEWPDFDPRSEEQTRWFPDEVAMHLGSKVPYSHPYVPFSHFILPLPPIPSITPHTTCTTVVYVYHKVLYQTYLTLLSHVQKAFAIYNHQHRTQLPVHYNMIMTSTFMMLVPRSRGYTYYSGLGNSKASQEVWVNSVGMLGMVWVKDKEEAEGWKVIGCERVLREVGIPR